MLVLSLVAALALSQAEPLVREPIRPDDGVAPRAELNRGTGGSGTNAEQSATTGTSETTTAGADLARTPADATGGSGAQVTGTPETTGEATAGTGGAGEAEQNAGFGVGAEDEAAAEKKQESALEAENRKLREQLEQVNGKLQQSLEVQQQSEQQLEAIKEQDAQIEERRQEEMAQRADTAARRESSLSSASQSLSGLSPDVLHDSSDYASALAGARWEIFRAGQLHPDPDTIAAQEALNQARQAFDNKDLQRMWLHVQEAQMYLGRAMQTPSNAE